MNLKFKIKNNKKWFSQHKNFFKNFCVGFTLIEVMVAVSIFAIVMMVAMGAVISIVGANKKAQSLNSVINNVNFAMESMIRDLRTGDGYHCEGGNSADCDSIRFESTIYGDRVYYSFNEVDGYGIIKQKVGEGGALSDFTSGDVDINELHFFLPTSNSSNKQPRILVTLKASSKSRPTLVFNLQTFVSQRKLQVEDVISTDI